MAVKALFLWKLGFYSDLKIILFGFDLKCKTFAQILQVEEMKNLITV